MKPFWLVISVLLNVALVAVLLWTHLFRLNHPAPTVPIKRTSPPDPGGLSHAPNPSPSVPEAAPFHWSQVESTDYLAYIANLRAIGCPEPTIRDIIVADVNSLFAPRYAALMANAPELSWWGLFNPRRPLRPELAAQIQTLNEEKAELLTRLLGDGTIQDWVFAEATVAAMREQDVFAFLDEAKRSAVRRLMDRYHALRDQSRPNWKGLPSDERDAMESALREARDRQLAAILTPEEMSEFLLRNSPASDAIRERFGRGDLTEAEFRELYRLRREFEEQHPNVRIEDWKELEAEYASTLGPGRFGELQRLNDPMWQAMQDLANEVGYSSDAMSQALALKEEYAEKLVQAVVQMFSDPERNPQPLRQLAAEMDARLATVLGAEAVGELDRRGVLPRLIIQDDGTEKRYSLSRSGFSE